MLIFPNFTDWTLNNNSHSVQLLTELQDKLVFRTGRGNSYRLRLLLLFGFWLFIRVEVFTAKVGLTKGLCGGIWSGLFGIAFTAGFRGVNAADQMGNGGNNIETDIGRSGFGNVGSGFKIGKIRI